MAYQPATELIWLNIGIASKRALHAGQYTI
jgi:hypothetical protein